MASNLTKAYSHKLRERFYKVAHSQNETCLTLLCGQVKGVFYENHIMLVNYIHVHRTQK